MNDELPQDPFGPPEDLLTMMRGYSQLHSAALLAGFPEHVATGFIARIFVETMQQNAPAQEE